MSQITGTGCHSPTLTWATPYLLHAIEQPPHVKVPQSVRPWVVRVFVRRHLDASLAHDAMEVVKHLWPRFGPWIHSSLQELEVPVPVSVVGAAGPFPQCEYFGEHRGRWTPSPKLIDFGTELHDCGRQLPAFKSRFVGRDQRNDEVSDESAEVCFCRYLCIYRAPRVAVVVRQAHPEKLRMSRPGQVGEFGVQKDAAHHEHCFSSWPLSHRPRMPQSPDMWRVATPAAAKGTTSARRPKNPDLGRGTMSKQAAATPKGVKLRQSTSESPELRRRGGSDPRSLRRVASGVAISRRPKDR